MSRSIPFAAAAALALATPASGQLPGASRIDGTYLDEGGYVEITVAPCGAARCGTITRIIRHKPGETGLDRHNDDPALRDRPILGLTILQNLRWDDGAWRGRVYNPEDGGTYRVAVKPGDGGGLEVRGCIAFFCQTQFWPHAS